jgi:hypothetical protein
MVASLSSAFNVNATLSGIKQTAWTIEADLKLDTIPRATTPFLGETTIPLGNSVMIQTQAASDSFRHNLYYNWYGTTNGAPTWVVIAKDVDSSYIWTVPKTFANNLIETDRGVGTIRCETYNGSTLVGTKDISFTGVVPATADFKPTLSVLVDEPTGYMGRYGALIKGFSTLRIKSNGSAKYNADIKAYKVEVDGVVYEGEDITTEKILARDTDLVEISVTVTDSRGIESDPFIETFSALDYTAPVISALSVHRCDENGRENDKGDHVRVTFSASITPLRNYNSATYTLRYSATGGDTSTQEIELPELSGEYVVNSYAIAPFYAEGSYSYRIEIEAKDDIDEATRQTSVSTAFTLMNWGPDGTSMAIGKVAEKPDTLQVALAHNQLGNTYAASSTGDSSSVNWVNVATISLRGMYVDAPITFVLTRRKERTPMTLHLQLRVDYGVYSTVHTFEYEGAKYEVALVRDGGNDMKYNLFVMKTEEEDVITVQRWWVAGEMSEKLEVSFPGNSVDELPSWETFEPSAAKLTSILDIVYPVGSIYMSVNNVSPSTFLGGSWAQIQNTFLLAAGSKYAAGSTGGAATHTLTTNEMPVHQHGIKWSNDSRETWKYTNVFGRDGTIGNDEYLGTSRSVSSYAAWVAEIAEAGGGAAHNNMPPYLAVYMWKRTA